MMEIIVGAGTNEMMENSYLTGAGTDLRNHLLCGLKFIQGAEQNVDNFESG